MKVQDYSKLTFLLLAILIFAQTTQTLAQQSQDEYWNRDYWAISNPQNDPNNIDVTVSTAYVTKYIWRGFDMFDDHAAIQPAIDMDWFDTGFSTGVWNSIPLSGGSVRDQEMRYIVAYSGSLWRDAAHTTDYSIVWTYYDFTNAPSSYRDAQEGGLQLTWPRLIPTQQGHIVPSYYIGKLRPAETNAANRNQGGWIHILGLGYDFPLYGLGAEQQLVHLSSELIYNDGMAAAARNVDHNFSHVVLGVSSIVQSENLTVTPALYYQISMENTVNDEDEIWCAITFAYKF